jgi:hypothetical protein
VLIELAMSRLDAPGPLLNFAQRCAEFNFPKLATLPGHGPWGFSDGQGDWGLVCADDAAENELSLKQGFRLLSAYPIDPANPGKGLSIRPDKVAARP